LRLRSSRLVHSLCAISITGAAVRDYISCPASLPYLPKLKYLSVNSKVGLCNGTTSYKHDKTPSLDHVYIRPSCFSNYWKHLLSAHGERLRFVTLDLRHDLTWAKVDSFECLSMLTSHCRNLSYLAVYVNDWNHCPRLDPLPPVAHLGIYLSFQYAIPATICEKLATVQSPSIKVVHLINDGMFEYLRSPHSRNMEGVSGPLAVCTFRVVDHEGRDLGPPGHSS